MGHGKDKWLSKSKLLFSEWLWQVTYLYCSELIQNINSGYNLAEVHRPARASLIEMRGMREPKIMAWKNSWRTCPVFLLEGGSHSLSIQHPTWWMQHSAVSKCLQLWGQMCACMLSRFSRVWLFATLWTVAPQAPLSMEFSHQEYWSGLPFPSPGDLPNLGIEPMSPGVPELASRFLTPEPPRKPVSMNEHSKR